MFRAGNALSLRSVESIVRSGVLDLDNVEFTFSRVGDAIGYQERNDPIGRSRDVDRPARLSLGAARGS